MSWVIVAIAMVMAMQMEMPTMFMKITEFLDGASDNGDKDAQRKNGHKVQMPQKTLKAIDVSHIM